MTSSDDLETLFKVGWVAFLVLSLGKVALDARRRRLAPCQHGVVGAKAAPAMCPTCLADARGEYIARVRAPEYLRRMDPREFEELACRLFAAMGYDVEPTRYSGDGGVDAFLRRDGALAILQAKRVHGQVGAPVLQQLSGIMAHHRATAGFVVTTGRVSSQAREWMKGKAITVYGLDELLALLDQHVQDFVPPGFKLPDSAILICPKCGNQLRIVKSEGKRFSRCLQCGYRHSL